MAASQYKLKFAAEIKQVSSRKLASLDVEYKLVVVTSDPSILNLGALNPEMLVDIEVTTQDD